MRNVFLILCLGFVLAGCGSLKTYMSDRQARGCYQGRIEVTPTGVGEFIGEGILLTGEMTAEECLQLRDALGR